MNYRSALKEGTEYLKSHGVPESELDAWYLLEYCTGISRTQYFVKQADEMSEEELMRYREVLNRRGQRIPLQHITGVQEFMGLEFLVNEHVLIPRQDTEILVEETLKRLRDGQKVLDMCTGSGCIIISLAMNRNIEATAVDISEKALEVAGENARRHDREIQFIESDLFEEVTQRFDCIVSNPPYIASEEVMRLMPEVREHEPLSALDGSKDGLYFYREIIKHGPEHLERNGWLLFEIGYDQGEAVSEMMRNAGFVHVEVKKDLAGLDRVVLGQRQ